MSGLIPDQCDPSLRLAYFVKFTCAPSLYKWVRSGIEFNSEPGIGQD